MPRSVRLHVRAAFRLARITAHLLLGTAITVGLASWRALGLRDRWTPSVVCWWYQRLTRMLGLRIETSGELEQAALLVSNHVSWLDIPVLGALGRLTFLSKVEVRSWPVIGWIAAKIGTVFIKRGANQSTQLIEQISQSIHAQRSVVIFPEGTTSDGLMLRRFHPRLLAAAQQPGTRAQPIAVRYGTNEAPDQTAPFVGDDALLPHLWRVLCHPGMQVRVQLLDPVIANGSDRKTLATLCWNRIAAALGLADRDDHPSHRSPGRGVAA